MARDELRIIDVIGRIGGDEFLLVLIQTELRGALECADRIRLRIARTDCVGNSATCQVTVSIGVAQHRQGESAPDTLRRADVVLYRAKATGRNRVAAD